MTLDVILPTFNREALLARTLDSIHRARVPATCRVRILVVDNASTDRTRALVDRETKRFSSQLLQYLFVPTPGKPHALNAGIEATDGDLVGLIDDDEELDPAWFECIDDAFRNEDLDFIGGKVLPRWDAARPNWLGHGYLGVIGWVDPGSVVRPMDASYPGILMGGNAVIRRRVLEAAGPYSTALNRTATRLLGCEDEDMYHRLLARGARGRYRPDLVVYHHVPGDRLTKKYFRRWCFWRGVSLGVMDRERPAPVPYLAGIPRYRIGRALRGLPGMIRLRGNPADRFEDELAWWDLAGLAWGKHFYRSSGFRGSRVGDRGSGIGDRGVHSDPNRATRSECSSRSPIPDPRSPIPDPRSPTLEPRNPGTPALSIVLPTYNRGSALSRAVESALDQTAPPESYEILVVNNNSTDDTAEVIDRLTRTYPGRVAGVLETRQGVAYARQAGIDRARGPIIGFFDDDVRVTREWVETILRTFREHPELDCIGGKVLPDWATPPPRWLTREHWAPLALQDFGDAPMSVSFENPRGLISANLACRASVFARVGGFSPDLQRVKDGIGSLEDDEWIRRLWKAGGRARYVPELVTMTEVPSTRLTRAYHRRWHRGHGRFYALLRAEEIETTSVGSFLGVPAHMYRSALGDVAGWLSAAFMGRSEQAFQHEVKLRFFRGFFGQRFLERLYS